MMKIKQHLTILALIFTIVQIVIGIVFLDIQRYHIARDKSGNSYLENLSEKKSETQRFYPPQNARIIDLFPYFFCFFSIQIIFNLAILIIFSTWAQNNIIDPIHHAIDRLSDNEKAKKISIAGYMPIEVFKLNQLLEQKSNQIASIKELSSIARTAEIIAHDIRRPIGMVQLILNQLRDRENLPCFIKNLDKYESSISESLESVDAILTDLMSLQGRPPDFRELTPLNILIHQAIKENLQFFFDSELEFKYRFEIDCSCLVDKIQIQRSISNIIHNAIIAMNGKGSIWFEIVNADQGINLIIGNSDSYISPDKQKRLFEAYYSTSKGGRGLGLSVAKLQLLAHGGNIKVVSCKQKGTEFHVFFPETLLSYTESDKINLFSSSEEFRKHLQT